MNRTVLFNHLRRAPFGGRLTREQVKGTESILDAFNRRYPEADMRWIAYTLASVFHETGARMAPVRETFASSDGQAIRRLDRAFAQGKLGQVSTPYWREGWFGRGQIQITWEDNYIVLDEATGHPIHAKPDLMLDYEVSADVAVVGMVEGLFTGHKLSDFFNDEADDPVNARRIVNGTDRAELIAKYYEHFLDAVRAARKAAPVVEDEEEVDTRAAEPDDRAPIRDPKIWTVITTFLTGLVGAVTSVASPYALAAVGFMLLAGLIIVWLFASGRLMVLRKE